MFIAHRGNVFGKTDQENDLLYMLRAVRAGFGVETDILRAPCGKLIISHDPAKWTSTNDAALVLNNLVMNDAFIALNIKEEGLLEDFLKLMGPDFSYKMEGFVFDFELCCSDPVNEMWDYSDVGFKIAERYSDRGERPSHYHGVDGADYIWLDEMDESGSLDLSEIDLKKIVYVSPELHGRPVQERRKEQFFATCADYCIAL